MAWERERERERERNFKYEWKTKRWANVFNDKYAKQLFVFGSWLLLEKVYHLTV